MNDPTGTPGPAHSFRTTVNTIISVVLPLLVLLAVVVGAIGGGTVVHARQATSTSLFSGSAAINTEKKVIGDITACGKSTGTIARLAYTTPPFQVDQVVLGPTMKVPGTTAESLAACLAGTFATSGATAALCPQQAAAASGLDPAQLPSFVTETVTCESGVESS
jgi:hypothetical protein